MANKHSLLDQLHHEDQKEAYRRMIARGYKPNDIERGNCVSLCKIDGKHLIKVKITPNGDIKQYAPTTATKLDIQMFA